MKKAVVVGGGVAGLTAAHELVERGFQVKLYERRPLLGGKAASGRAALGPTEHGFRFFPSWYVHLPDTMSRIPDTSRRSYDPNATVFDNLVSVNTNLVASYGGQLVPVLVHAPRSLEDTRTLQVFLAKLQDIGLPAAEALFFLQRLAAFLRVPDAKRREAFDHQTWWEFLDGDSRSQAFQTLIAATTRTTVAAHPKRSSAYTIANMAIRTFSDAFSSMDRVLNGPTNEKWIDDWESYLRSRGVDIALDKELTAITFDGQAPRISELTFRDVRRHDQLRTLRIALETVVEWRGALECQCMPLLAARLKRARDAQERLAEQLAPETRADRLTRGGIDLTSLLSERVSDGQLAVLESQLQAELASFELKMETERADERTVFIFAVPLEQMAYFVNRSPMATYFDPKLKNLIPLVGAMSWMAGIQFYLREPMALQTGHVICNDSEWALTCIQQTDWWRDVTLPPGVRSILSVDISSWDTPGRFNRKAAFNCSREEVAEEVWAQLEESFNRPDGPKVLRRAQLLTGEVASSFHLAQSIVDRRDRRKQAAYENQRSLRFSADSLLSNEHGFDSDDAPFIAGAGSQVNAEPLLINRPGSLALRPSVTTAINNLYLAGDYVDTHTNIPCMEGANESARRAVNAILDRFGDASPRCKVWSFQDAELLGRMLPFVGELDLGLVGEVMSTARAGALRLAQAAFPRRIS